MSWDVSTDVVVVGLGGAGACAALEARAAGAEVLALDRFHGGGATAISGGVVYAGGGTHIQREAGVEDTADAMFAYLQQEVKGVVSDATLRDFCDTSVSNLRWLADHGVPFRASLCPVKTSYPTDDYFLYYSGNEGFPPYRDTAKPAARGHRAVGTSLPGRNFFEPLRAAVLASGVSCVTQCRVRELVEDNGRVVGVVATRLTGAVARRHDRLEKLAIKLVNYVPGFAKRLRRSAAALEEKHGEVLRIEARRGVILSAGGFIYNRAMVKQYAAPYRRGMPLGTSGCGGLGIQLGMAVGGAVDNMARVSAWRFLNPPEALVRGMLLNAQGARYVNESLYGAAVGDALVDDNDGVGLLVIDQQLKDTARMQVGRGKTQWFQTAPALLNLWFNCRKAESVEALARLGRFDLATLQATLDAYNAAIAADAPDAFGKELRQTLRPPFYLMDCGIQSKVWPLPTLTLGGLVVDEGTGGVKREDGSVIDGLYAAGRNAVGICGRQYVSGLSIADCVYSGRRAGAAAAARRSDALDAAGVHGGGARGHG